MSWNYKDIYLPEHRKARLNGCVLEHILVAEETLGRELLLGEVIHHKDENRSNNSPDNLIIFASQSDHSRFHRTGLLELTKNGSYISPKQYEDTCKCCGKKLKWETKSQLCKVCFDISKRKTERPSRDQLLEDVNLLGYCGTGRKYNVSDNAIRKWLKNMGSSLMVEYQSPKLKIIWVRFPAPLPFKLIGEQDAI